MDPSVEGTSLEPIDRAPLVMFLLHLHRPFMLVTRVRSQLSAPCLERVALFPELRRDSASQFCIVNLQIFAGSHLFGQEIARLLWNPKVQCHVR